MEKVTVCEDEMSAEPTWREPKPALRATEPPPVPVADQDSPPVQVYGSEQRIQYST